MSNRVNDRTMRKHKNSLGDGGTSGCNTSRYSCHLGSQVRNLRLLTVPLAYDPWRSSITRSCLLASLMSPRALSFSQFWFSCSLNLFLFCEYQGISPLNKPMGHDVMSLRQLGLESCLTEVEWW